MSIELIRFVVFRIRFQSLLMFASVFAVIAVAAVEVGGLSEIWRIGYDYGRVEFFKYVHTVDSRVERIVVRVVDPR